MLCEDCTLGHKEIVAGNGITEPPYLQLIRCPYEREFYKYPDDECCHDEEREENLEQT